MGPFHFNMARPERFELPTTWFVARYSIQLSYGRVAWIARARILSQRISWPRTKISRALSTAYARLAYAAPGSRRHEFLVSRYFAKERVSQTATRVSTAVVAAPSISGVVSVATGASNNSRPSPTRCDS